MRAKRIVNNVSPSSSLVERNPEEVRVGGSIPSLGTIKRHYFNGRKGGR